MSRNAACIGFLIAGLAGVPAMAEPAPSGPILVILPERIEVEWYWYFYTTEVRHLVQSEVEKALVRADMDVIDLTAADALATTYDLDGLLTQSTALDAARSVGAAYLVHGRAIAVRASSSTAYGLSVHRSQADISANLIRVEDGKVLAAEDVVETGGGESQPIAARKALREGGRKVAGKLVRALKNLDE